MLLGKVCGQPLRQTTGFARSLLNLMGLGAYQVLDYSTLCKRQGSLSAEVSEAIEPGKKLDIAIYSTGLKEYGEGEWKVRKHGASKRRVWQKMHIGIDIHTQHIVSVKLTSHAVDEVKAAADMVKGQKGSALFGATGRMTTSTSGRCWGRMSGRSSRRPKTRSNTKAAKRKKCPKLKVNANKPFS